MSCHLIWLRNNLRLLHNPVLNHLEQLPRLLVYIYDPEENFPWPRGQASLCRVQSSLHQLQRQCQSHQQRLNILIGDPQQIIPELAQQFQAACVSWQPQDEPALHHRDQRIISRLNQLGIATFLPPDGLLPDKSQCLTSQGQPYRVFTPFYRQLRQQLQRQLAQALPQPDFTQPGIKLPGSVPVDQLQPPHPWQKRLMQYQWAGETAAQQQLHQFIQQPLLHYQQQRDFPALEATSHLSAALHVGEISPRQIVLQLLPVLQHGTTMQQTQAESYLRQLIWREFSRYILWHYPQTQTRPMNNNWPDEFWQPDREKLQRWQQGETGIDLIDAAMRQLWITGEMHNRLRMLCASFLCKNLQQHWLDGARWFWDTLIDADLANNNMGWQWCAGCGADAAPYFRIFNPVTQQQKFDAQGDYVRRWLPAGKRPPPIVNLKQSRHDALQRYQQIIKGRQSK